jgi:hypothetical protein
VHEEHGKHFATEPKNLIKKKKEKLKPIQGHKILTYDHSFMAFGNLSLSSPIK